MDLGMLVNFGDARERYLDEYEELLGSCGFAVHEMIGSHLGLAFSIADRESLERPALGGRPSDASDVGKLALVELR